MDNQQKFNKCIRESKKLSKEWVRNPKKDEDLTKEEWLLASLMYMFGDKNEE